jgi:hypothetical protein
VDSGKVNLGQASVLNHEVLNEKTKIVVDLKGFYGLPVSDLTPFNYNYYFCAPCVAGHVHQHSLLLTHIIASQLCYWHPKVLRDSLSQPWVVARLNRQIRFTLW